jgi:AraC-like DNA-binding protein
MIGKMSREDIAVNLGVSLVSLKRAFRGTSLAFYNYCSANPGLVKQVCKFYEKHSQEETAKAFGLKRKQVDHIVHRYKQHRSPKQVRWTDREIHEAAKMAGLISTHAQARYFKRPNAFNGSIKALWMKRFGMSQGSVNGMAHWAAKEIVDSSAQYLRPKGESRRGEPVDFRWLVLWVDMERCLRPEVPPFIREAISTMANFQRWLWKDKKPKPKILKMIQEREIA